jgi:DNA-binding XRE family transcriptional regulator
MNYADAFKSLRHAYRLTQAEFAKLLQISKPTVQKLEGGNYPPSEKITAGLVELFRSERFRSEFRPRVEAGDLHPVRAAFGDLLDLVDAEMGGALPVLGRPASVPTGNIADIYADLRKDYSEFRDIVRAQQTTIQTLSESSHNWSLTGKNLSDSTKNLTETSKNLSESTKNFSISTKNLSESNKNLSESIKNLTGSVGISKNRK